MEIDQAITYPPWIDAKKVITNLQNCLSSDERKSSEVGF